MTWNRTFDDGVTEGPSRVTWEIEPLGETCRLRLVHDDFHGTTRVFAMVGRGWPIVLSSLKTLLETDDDLAVAVLDDEPVDDTADIDKLDHREWGINANQRVWALLADGDADPTKRPVASWSTPRTRRSGTGRTRATSSNRQRGEWLISHVYAVLGDGPAALRHAHRCCEITEAEGYEGLRPRVRDSKALARAYAVSGDADAAAEWRDARGQGRHAHRGRRRPQDLRVRPRVGLEPAAWHSGDPYAVRVNAKEQLDARLLEHVHRAGRAEPDDVGEADLGARRSDGRRPRRAGASRPRRRWRCRSRRSGGPSRSARPTR